MKPTWSVVVVYEDSETREEAVRFCDQLVERFWSRCEFDLKWWSFALLQEPLPHADATEKALTADLIVFATRPDGELPSAATTWIASWLSRRGDREGTLIGLLEPESSPAGVMPAKYVYLRNVACQAGMDYLTHVPQELQAISDSADAYSERANQVTSLLNDILHHAAPPPRLPSA